jgi:uncharacterized protein (TIGR03067 family)
VSVPVKAYAAVRSAPPSPFHFLHADCGQRIRYEKHCPQHGVVPAEAIVRGYEYTPDHYIIMETEELEQLRPARDHALIVEQFVPVGDIDPLFFAGRISTCFPMARPLNTLMAYYRHRPGLKSTEIGFLISRVLKKCQPAIEYALRRTAIPLFSFFCWRSLMRQLLALMALGLLVGADSPNDDAKKVQEKLQGTWKAVTAERRGKSKEDDEEHHLIFDGNKFSIKRAGQTMIQGTFKLDPSKKPKEIDMKITEDENGKHQGKTALGIYALDGDTLKWCVAEPGTTERPKEFSAPADTKLMFITLKREKSK